MNASIVQLLDRLAVGRRSLDLQLHCECGSSDCGEVVQLRRDEYERARAAPTRFLVSPGHSPAGVPQALLEAGRCVVVELSEE